MPAFSLSAAHSDAPPSPFRPLFPHKIFAHNDWGTRLGASWPHTGLVIGQLRHRRVRKQFAVVPGMGPGGHALHERGGPRGTGFKLNKEPMKSDGWWLLLQGGGEGEGDWCLTWLPPPPPPHVCQLALHQTNLNPPFFRPPLSLHSSPPLLTWAN